MVRKVIKSTNLENVMFKNLSNICQIIREMVQQVKRSNVLSSNHKLNTLYIQMPLI